jgi:8-oxo-dGTP diphosphatase
LDIDDCGVAGQHGVVAVIVRTGRLLVIRRSQHVVAPGALCFPGGAIEQGETQQAALVRELEEELGVAIDPVERIWESITPWRVRISWWRAELSPTIEPKPFEQEVSAFYWMSPRELHDREDLLASNREFLAALSDGEFALEGLADFPRG